MVQERARFCVIVGCDKKAVGACNNCSMPICDRHGRKQSQFYLCSNCYEIMRKMRLRQQ